MDETFILSNQPDPFSNHPDLFTNQPDPFSNQTDLFSNKQNDIIFQNINEPHNNSGPEYVEVSQNNSGSNNIFQGNINQIQLYTA